MQNKFTSRSKHLDFIILDLICIEVSYWLAYYIRFGRLVNSTPGEYTMMNIMVILIHLSIMFISEGVFWNFNAECHTGIEKSSHS